MNVQCRAVCTATILPCQLEAAFRMKVETTVVCADGETKPESYGATAVAAAPTDEARLDAYTAELEGR